MARATMAQDFINHCLETISNDLLVLASHNAAAEAILDSQIRARRVLEDEYLDFCKRETIFVRLSLVDSSGRETIKIERNNGEFAIVSRDSLVYLKDKDFLEETLKLDKREVDFSSFMADVDGDVIGDDGLPMIRAASPVFSSDGVPTGSIVLECPAFCILKYVPDAVQRGMDRAMLVNHRGEKLLGEWPGYASDSTLQWREQARFQDSYPEEWSKVGRSGKGHFRTDHGLFTFVVMGHPDSDDGESGYGHSDGSESHVRSRSTSVCEWILILRTPPGNLANVAATESAVALLVTGGVAFSLGLVCWILVGALVQRREKHDTIQKIYERVSALTGEPFFHSLVEGLCEILNVEYAIVGEIIGKDYRKIRSLSFCSDGVLSDNIEYNIADTPCEMVTQSTFRVYPSGVQELFPKDKDLVDMNAESYIGMSLVDSKGKPLGVLAALGKSAFTSEDFGRHEFLIFATKASAELERIQSERALKNSEHILKESQKAGRIGSYRLDTAAGIWESSDILDSIFGIDDNFERTVEGWLRIVHADDRERMKSYLSEVQANCIDFDIEYRIVRPRDQSLRWVHAMGTFEIDENGHPVEMIGTVQDITERKTAEDALRESEHRYQELFTSLLEGVCMVDEHETVIFCNPAFSKLLEEEGPYEVIGKSVLDYLAPGQKEKIMAQTAIRRRNVCSKYEVEVITARQNHRVFQLSVSPNFNEKGEYCGSSANIVDLTEVRRLQELESRAQRLETAGQVAGQVAHDFNNLLAPLISYPELIREEIPDNHSTLKYLDAIEKSAEKIAAINEQLLTLGRRGHYNFVPIDLNRIVRQAAHECKHSHHAIEFQISLESDPALIMGGPAQIHRVILNLIENACDSMHDSGTISIGTENCSQVKSVLAQGDCPREGEYVKLTIADSGIGIKEEHLHRIFDPFFTSKETDRVRGSGLGLSVVHSVVKDHKGYIDVDTRIGEGTSFCLYFPITQDAVLKMEGDEPRGGGESILIVDDDPLQREVYGNLLSNLGYDITPAKSGEEAIEILSENRFDLLILDMVMATGIDGTETYRQALSIHPDQKAIIVSGYSESSRVTEAESLGVGAFVKKPLTRNVIARAVREELERESRLVAVT